MTNDKYEQIRSKIFAIVDECDLGVATVDRETLEARAFLHAKEMHYQGNRSLAQDCVNYLRHSSAGYESTLAILDNPGDLLSTQEERHVLHLTKRFCKARLKKRVLDEIATLHPWLKEECNRQKMRDGVEENPGSFILPFGPFRGTPLRRIDIDYLIRLLGDGSVKKSFRTRIERHVAERMVEPSAV